MTPLRFLPPALLAFSLACPAPVTELKAEYRGGQVFLTFKEAAGATGYTVYRSDKAITALSGLTAIASVPPGSGTNRYTNTGFVITDQGTPLSAGTGLLVLTSKAKGSFHYAVVHPGDASLVAGSNATAAAVAETPVEVPAAVQIGPATVNAEKMSVRPMFAWEDHDTWDHSKGFYGHRYNLAVAPNTSGAEVPLTLVLHSAGNNGYREPDSYFDKGVGVAIFPRDLCFTSDQKDPYTNSDRFHSGWFGYGQGNVAVNSTERRLMRYVNLALGDPALKVDKARVYVRGTSMGGGGSLHLAYHHPHAFAAAAPTIGWVDPDAWARGNWVKFFGPPENRMPVNAPGGPSWWDWQNMAFLVESWPGRLPPIIHTYRKDDDIINEASYPGLLEKTEARRQAQISRWQDGGHRAFGLDNNADFLRFRLDEAYPAFAGASSSDAFSVQEGQRNVNLDWSSRHHDLFAGSADAIADSVGGFAMTFKSLAADAEASVTIRNAQQFLPFPGDTVKWTNRAQAGSSLLDSGTAVADAEGLLTARIKVTAAGNRLQLLCAACRQPARRALIREFLLPDLNPLPLGVINQVTRTIALTVPAGTDLKALRPRIAILGDAVTPASGQAVDFSAPSTYKVTAGGTETLYTVEVKRGPVSLKRRMGNRDGRKGAGGGGGPVGPVRPRGQGAVYVGPDSEGNFYSPSGRAQPPQTETGSKNGKTLSSF